MSHESAAFQIAAVQFCHDVGDISTPTDVLAALGRVSAHCDMTAFSAWLAPTRANDFKFWEYKKTIFYDPAFKSPDEYLKEYRNMAMRYGVSSLATYSSEATYAFTLTEAMRALRLTGKQDWIFNFMRRYGTRDGLQCPYRKWVIVYSSSTVLPYLSPGDRALLYMAGGAAVGQIDKIVKRPIENSQPTLTQRETQILRLISYGKTMNEIAEQMGISLSTVKDAMQRICRKLNAEGSAHAVAEAFRRGLLQ